MSSPASYFLLPPAIFPPTVHFSTILNSHPRTSQVQLGNNALRSPIRLPLHSALSLILLNAQARQEDVDIVRLDLDEFRDAAAHRHDDLRGAHLERGEGLDETRALDSRGLQLEERVVEHDPGAACARDDGVVLD